MDPAIKKPNFLSNEDSFCILNHEKEEKYAVPSAVSKIYSEHILKIISKSKGESGKPHHVEGKWGKGKLPISAFKPEHPIEKFFTINELYLRIKELYNVAEQPISDQYDEFVIKSAADVFLNSLATNLDYIIHEDTPDVNLIESLLYDLFNCFIINIANAGSVKFGRLGKLIVSNNKIVFEPTDELLYELDLKE